MTISTSCAAEIKQAVQKQSTFKRECALRRHGYAVSNRDPQLGVGTEGRFMVTGSSDGGHDYMLIGNNRDELINLAYRHLLETISISIINS